MEQSDQHVRPAHYGDPQAANAAQAYQQQPQAPQTAPQAPQMPYIPAQASHGQYPAQPPAPQPALQDRPAPAPQYAPQQPYPQQPYAQQPQFEQQPPFQPQPQPPQAPVQQQPFAQQQPYPQQQTYAPQPAPQQLAFQQPGVQQPFPQQQPYPPQPQPQQPYAQQPYAQPQFQPQPQPPAPPAYQQPPQQPQPQQSQQPYAYQPAPVQQFAAPPQPAPQQQQFVPQQQGHGPSMDFPPPPNLSPVRDAFANGAAPFLEPGEQVYCGFILKLDDTIEETPRELQIAIEGQHHTLGDIHRTSGKINRGMKWAANPMDTFTERLAEKSVEALNRKLAGPVFVGGWMSQAGLFIRYVRATAEDFGPGAYGALTSRRYLVFRGARLGGAAMRLVYAVPRTAIAGVRTEGTKGAALRGRTPRAELHFTDGSMVATMMPTKSGEQVAAVLQVQMQGRF